MKSKQNREISLQFEFLKKPQGFLLGPPKIKRLNPNQIITLSEEGIKKFLEEINVSPEKLGIFCVKLGLAISAIQKKLKKPEKNTKKITAELIRHLTFLDRKYAGGRHTIFSFTTEKNKEIRFYKYIKKNKVGVIFIHRSGQAKSIEDLEKRRPKNIDFDEFLKKFFNAIKKDKEVFEHFLNLYLPRLKEQIEKTKDENKKKSLIGFLENLISEYLVRDKEQYSFTFHEDGKFFLVLWPDEGEIYCTYFECKLPIKKLKDITAKREKPRLMLEKWRNASPKNNVHITIKGKDLKKENNKYFMLHFPENSSSEIIIFDEKFKQNTIDLKDQKTIENFIDKENLYPSSYKLTENDAVKFLTLIIKELSSKIEKIEKKKNGDLKTANLKKTGPRLFCSDTQEEIKDLKEPSKLFANFKGYAKKIFDVLFEKSKNNKTMLKLYQNLLKAEHPDRVFTIKVGAKEHGFYWPIGKECLYSSETLLPFNAKNQKNPAKFASALAIGFKQPEKEADMSIWEKMQINLLQAGYEKNSVQPFSITVPTNDGKKRKIFYRVFKDGELANVNREILEDKEDFLDVYEEEKLNEVISIAEYKQLLLEKIQPINTNLYNEVKNTFEKMKISFKATIEGKKEEFYWLPDESGIVRKEDNSLFDSKKYSDPAQATVSMIEALELPSAKNIDIEKEKLYQKYFTDSLYIDAYTKEGNKKRFWYQILKDDSDGPLLSITSGGTSLGSLDDLEDEYADLELKTDFASYLTLLLEKIKVVDKEICKSMKTALLNDINKELKECFIHDRSSKLKKLKKLLTPKKTHQSFFKQKTVEKKGKGKKKESLSLQKK